MAKLLSGSITSSDISPTAGIPASATYHLHKHITDFGYPITGTRKVQIATRAKVGGTAGWTVAAADNLPYLATLAAGQSAATLVVPIDGLPIGATITGFRVVAQIESAGGAVTLDANLRAVTNVAGEPTDASIGSITQISVTADTASSVEKTALTEVVTSGKSYYLLFTGTTAASTDIILQHCEVYYTTSDGLQTTEVILFVAEKAGTIIEVGAGLYTDGSSTAIAFDLQISPSTSMLSSTIAVTDSTGDRTEVAGTISGNGAYTVGAVVKAVMTVTTATGAVGPWLRVVREENGD